MWYISCYVLRVFSLHKRSEWIISTFDTTQYTWEMRLYSVKVCELIVVIKASVYSERTETGASKCPEISIDTRANSPEETQWRGFQ